MIHIVSGILVREGALLLGRRAPTKRICPEMWDVIGGHVEAGETFEQTLARELKEEIGVIPVASVSLGSIPFAHDGKDVVFHMFRVDRWEGEPSLANDENTELRWFGSPTPEVAVFRSPTSSVTPRRRPANGLSTSD